MHSSFTISQIIIAPMNEKQLFGVVMRETITVSDKRKEALQAASPTKL
jgi:hypothetical protein